MALVIILWNDIEMENKIKAINKDGREEDKTAITNLLDCILFYQIMYKEG